MRITVWVLRPPAEPVKFFLSVEQDATFQRVWDLVQRRYRENYSAGRRNLNELTRDLSDYYFKKLQDSTGADIDMRDTVIDIFGEIVDPVKRIVQTQTLPLGRDDTVPFDSHLHPPIVPPSSQEQQEIDRRRLEFNRYGATLDNLDPDHPVESNESTAEKRIDQDGFAIPARVNRPPRAHVPLSSQTAPSSQLLSQVSYEDHFVQSPELGSPQKAPTSIPRFETPPAAANTASQYSTLDAVPSAQKPPAARVNNNRSPVVSPTEIETAHDLADPISEDSQPRLSSSITRTPARSSGSNKRKSLGSSESRETNRQNLANPWTEDELESLIGGLAKGLTNVEIKQRYLPNRSVDSIRKKATAHTKLNPLAVQERKASLAASWTQDQDAHFVRAIRNNQSWKTLRDHRFRDQSDDSVKVHYAKVRKRLQEEDATKSARVHYQEQLKDGTPSTGPNEKFTQEEDDLLLACRVENVEMKRVAKELFPLRPLEQVTNRAGNLFHSATRAAAKVNPMNLGGSPSVDFLWEHSPDTRDRVEAQREKAREFKKKSGTARAKEFEDMSHQKSLVNSDKKRAEERREKEERQRQRLEASENAREQDERIKRRRLDDDLQREDNYKQRLAAWEKQAAIDKQAGRAIRPRPVRPLGSSIGTEILSTPGPASNRKEIAAGASKSGSSTTLLEQGTKKRRPSDVEVQVVITSSKKQKTAAAAEVTPQVKPSEVKAASAYKAPAVSTPKRSAPPVIARSAMAKLGRTTQPQKAGTDLESAHQRPLVALASIAATQPARPSASFKSAKEQTVRDLSSPGISTAKSLRQSKLPFLLNGQQLPTPTAKKSTPASVRKSTTASARKSTPASVTPRVHAPIDDSIFISSDEESSYDDKDITDEEMLRYEAMHSSSPVRSPQKNTAESSVQHNPQVPFSPGASALRSSPPVASMPTPKAKVLYGSAALRTSTKTETPLASTMPSIPISETTRATNSEHQEAFDALIDREILSTTQGDEMPGFEMSTAENVFSDNEEDVSMLDEDQTVHATHSTPVFPSSSPSVRAQDRTSVSSPNKDTADETSAIDHNSRQPATKEPEAASVPSVAAKNITNNVTNSEKKDQPHSLSDEDDVEEIDCYRSDSREIEGEDWPSEKSEGGMPFRSREDGSFGPFKVYKIKRTTHLNAAVQPRKDTQPTTQKLAATSEGKSIGEQAMEIISSPAANAVPTASTAEAPLQPSPSRPQNLQDRSFTSPAAQSSEEYLDVDLGVKKARRGQRRKKDSRILADADSFKPPPSTAPPDILSGSGLRSPSKRALRNGCETTAKHTNGTGSPKHVNNKNSPSSSQTKTSTKGSKKQSKPKRQSLGLDEATKNMLEKGQAFGSLSQATPTSRNGKVKQPSSTQPVKKAVPMSDSNNVASSQPASNANAGRTINPHAFDWDNAQDSDELIRQADQRLLDAANMAPEDFWQRSNLVNMNEEQVLSHMIEQGVKLSAEKRRRRRESEREDPNAAAQVLENFTTDMSATQPVQRSVVSPGMNNAMPRPATQPVMQVSKQIHDDDSSSTSDDSDEEDNLLEAMENYARHNLQKKPVALPRW
ncbi:hypothetical protein E4T49_04900 [Aureobasidium sp. EXF-10728]|nr:hypothetical protein E4T49_04900 [Aureobasidium sp. EXF-10728]